MQADIRLHRRPAVNGIRSNGKKGLQDMQNHIGPACAGLLYFVLCGCVEKLDSSEKDAVRDAIEVIAGQGFSWEATQLKKALDSGRIRKDDNLIDDDGRCAQNELHDNQNPCASIIVVATDYLTAPTDFLAALLVHEISHCVYPVTDAGHCLVFWREYKFGRSLAHPTPAQTANQTHIGCMYPSFATAIQDPPPYVNGEGPGNKPSANVANNGHHTIYLGDATGQLHHLHTIDGMSSPPTAGILQLPLSAVTAIAVGVDATGTQYVIAAGMPTTLGSDTLAVVRDTDADEIVDTVVVLPGSGIVAAPRSLRRIGGGSSAGWYILDGSSSAVFKLHDATGDEIPDAVGSLFATSGLSPHIATASALYHSANFFGGDQEDDHLVITSANADVAAADDWGVVLYDLDGDGVADSASEARPLCDWFAAPPVRLGGGQALDKFVLLTAPTGHQIKVLGERGASGVFDVLLGTGAVHAPNHTELVHVPSGYKLGKRFLLRDTVTARDSEIYVVTPQQPTVAEVQPRFGNIGVTADVSVTGFNLPNDLVVWFGEVPGTIVQRSSSGLVVTAPALGAGSAALPVVLKFVSGGKTVDENWTYTYLAP